MTIPAPSIASETLFSIGTFEIRNTMLMAWAAMTVITVIALAARATRYKLVPGRLQAFFEYGVETLFDFTDSVLGDRKAARFFFPFIATLFLFILIANWLGIIPGLATITIEGVHNGHPVEIPVIRSMNADVNMTLVFALMAIIGAQVTGLLTIGILPHLRKYLIAPWEPPYAIGTMIGVLEIVSELSRVLSFTFRLFGNIFAGEVLLVVISFLVPYVLPIPFYGLEVFVGFVQALVFAMLSLVFLKMAMTSH